MWLNDDTQEADCRHQKIKNKSEKVKHLVSFLLQLTYRKKFKSTLLYFYPKFVLVWTLSSILIFLIILLPTFLPTKAGDVGAYASNNLNFSVINTLILHVEGCKDLWINVNYLKLKLNTLLQLYIAIHRIIIMPFLKHLIRTYNH